VSFELMSESEALTLARSAERRFAAAPLDKRSLPG
jgi:hypothetical protein